MPTRKNNKSRSKKRTGKKIYSQVGCAKGNKGKKPYKQNGGASGLMHADPPIIFSRTVYPLEMSGGLPNPIDASMQKGGKSRRHQRRYSRKYYKQSGGAPYSLLVGPANYADQPVNNKYTDSNPFRT
jgi:hypothetical protein